MFIEPKVLPFTLMITFCFSIDFTRHLCSLVRNKKVRNRKLFCSLFDRKIFSFVFLSLLTIYFRGSFVNFSIAFSQHNYPQSHRNVMMLLIFINKLYLSASVSIVCTLVFSLVSLSSVFLPVLPPCRYLAYRQLNLITKISQIYSNLVKNACLCLYFAEFCNLIFIPVMPADQLLASPCLAWLSRPSCRFLVCVQKVTMRSFATVPEN